MRLQPLPLVLSAPPAAAPTDRDWLDGLTTRVGAALNDGKPLVVEVHGPLGDKSISPCGNDKLGDGDTPIAHAPDAQNISPSRAA